MSDVDKWRRDPASFLKQQGLNPVRTTPSVDKEVFVLIVEGFLIFNYRYTRKALVKSLSSRLAGMLSRGVITCKSGHSSLPCTDYILFQLDIYKSAAASLICQHSRTATQH